MRIDDPRIHPSDQLVLYVYGEQSVLERHAVDVHLGTCANCRDAVRRLTVSREAALAAPEVVLDDERFDHIVRAVTVRAPRSGRSAQRRQWLYAGVLAAGLVAMVYRLTPDRDARQAVDTTPALAPRARDALALLARPASQERMRGIQEGRPVLGTDARVSAAFVRTLRTDPSPNVRLAVVDALDGAIPRQFEAELSAALRDERSPAVRRAMVDLFEAIGSDRARAALRDVASRDPDAALRARATAALARLRDGAADAKR